MIIDSKLTSPYNLGSTSVKDNNVPLTIQNDISIKGEMVEAYYCSSALEQQAMNISGLEYEEQVKKELLKILLENIKNNKNILFTKIFDPASFDTKYLARIFVVPNEQVQIIRDYYKK